MKKVLPLILAITVLLTACGAKATPTIDAPAVQASAVAMAFTMAAQTQSAMPTATLIPPSPTATFPPPASPTAFALPTFPIIMPTATLASTGTCSVPLAKNPTGRMTTLRILNENKAQVQGSICLAKTPFGEFGVIGVVLSRNQDIILTVPQGCYSAYFWVNNPKKQSTATGYGLCMNNSDKWTMKIRSDSVILNPP